MNATFIQVVKYCGSKLETYQRCVENHNKDWTSECLEQKRELTKCSEENVPDIRKMKEKCQEVIDAFDECLAKNKEDPEVCREKLRDLYNCTEATMDINITKE
ncbi:9353_t:CDS:2 [Scutellospora calospora]|uniref:9353_t:CDS:1 n=1 Tax=Scutellospora calospora TaxID=85575 RepID=A0ACA9KA00_9GLOM|nr:9353_t:CDS:2 [Scutellospora calospora]